jgi:hypothetical protein
MKHPTEAAIRLADGKVFVENFHGHALEKAADAGYSGQVLEKAKLGFSHSDGTAFYQATQTLFIESVESWSNSQETY